MDLTHQNLCKLAVEWLQRPSSRKGPGCVVAVSETQNAINNEIPDAIGWRPYRHGGCGATVVEVKVSRADFLADAGKPHRQAPELGMGAYRYYMAPVDLISEADLPPRWGLIEVTERGHIKVRCGHVFASNCRPEELDNQWRHEQFNVQAEISLLALALARVGDPQKFQGMLREAGNRASRLDKEVVQLRERIRVLENEKHALIRKELAF
ncbi:adenylosuccinate synthase [Chromobacterium haemolyticum]|uniref:Adenylosuccinate synthase n=1 Tax=Chromobacterium fluminis TaxID=3044269 RepID=A0ABX0LJQ4_9NEIS|nr:adenylosuccinate synthase [Chromobacterium haemolyticum]NHR07427.1 adenylosuccinate synthase [Chromobacterium haemolyticum]